MYIYIYTLYHIYIYISIFYIHGIKCLAQNLHSKRPAKHTLDSAASHAGAAPRSAEPPGDETRPGQSGHSDLHPADDD